MLYIILYNRSVFYQYVHSIGIKPSGVGGLYTVVFNLYFEIFASPSLLWVTNKMLILVLFKTIKNIFRIALRRKENLWGLLVALMVRTFPMFSSGLWFCFSPPWPCQLSSKNSRPAATFPQRYCAYFLSAVNPGVNVCGLSPSSVTAD